MSSLDIKIPTKGGWPVDPQDDIAISQDRIWIDGCFDFSHHGHAGAMLQARRLGKELLVGVHSDEEIKDNKGPTVMTLKERVSAVNACRWSSKVIPCAPYVTSLPWISHYGCHYVVHGDDVTSDGSGQDCYRFVKEAGRFLVVKRTPGISTTDLVGRMLLYSKNHFIHSLSAVLNGQEGPGPEEGRRKLGESMTQRIHDFASDESGHGPGSEVWIWNQSDNSHAIVQGFNRLVAGRGPRDGQRVVYVDGGFDLFSSGHIEFLRLVHEAEEEAGKARGWDDDVSKQARLHKYGEDYRPAYIIAGIHDDLTVNRWKGANYPIMNIFERGLCALQCKYIHSIIFSAPFIVTENYLSHFPFHDGPPQAVYHGPTSFNPSSPSSNSTTTMNNDNDENERETDVYAVAKRLGIFRQIPPHSFQHVNAQHIVHRILTNRQKYEARQRAKDVKTLLEADLTLLNPSTGLA